MTSPPLCSLARLVPTAPALLSCNVLLCLPQELVGDTSREALGEEDEDDFPLEGTWVSVALPMYGIRVGERPIEPRRCRQGIRNPSQHSGLYPHPVLRGYQTSRRPSQG